MLKWIALRIILKIKTANFQMYRTFSIWNEVRFTLFLNRNIALNKSITWAHCYLKLWIGVRPFDWWFHPVPHPCLACVSSSCYHRNFWPFETVKGIVWHCYSDPMEFLPATVILWHQWHFQHDHMHSGNSSVCNLPFAVEWLDIEFDWSYWDLQRTLEGWFLCTSVDQSPMNWRVRLILSHNPSAIPSNLQNKM